MQHALLVISIMALWQLVHLGTPMYATLECQQHEGEDLQCKKRGTTIITVITIIFVIIALIIIAIIIIIVNVPITFGYWSMII